VIDISGYRITAKIAHGACAEIFTGVDEGSGAQVAIKRLHPRHADNPREHSRLKGEGELGLAMGHALADGLRFLHKAGVCHKDLKPDNIMVRTDGVVKMLDLGFAERAGGLKLFSRRHLEGSPPYMAPELLATKQATAATDLYALGCTLYECASGITPFGAMSGKEVMANQMNMRLSAASPREANPALSLPTEVLILTAIRKDPGARYKSADEVLLDLARNQAWRSVKDPRAVIRPLVAGG
jgi:serine/threonine-protein kinase